MANDYLVYKWTLWFRMFDADKKGKICKEDAREEEELFAKLNHIEAERKQEVMDALDYFWDAVVFHGKPGPITETEFIDSHKEAYRANQDEFVDRMKKCYETLFKIFGVSEKETITCDEFINGLRAFHHDDITLEKTYFESYHPEGGKLKTNELVNSWVQFATCNDSTQRDYVKEALENGL